MTVSPSQANVNVGQTVSLQASNGGVKWSSKHPAIATVSSTGVVRGVAPGVATIVARKGSQQASAQITVVAVAPPPDPDPVPEPEPVPTPSVLYLSDLPFVSEANGWGPVERDKSNGEQAAGDGVPLSIGGVVHAKGVGVHAPSEIVVQVPSGMRSFRAKIGVDDEVGSNGRVTFEIWADGTRKYQSVELTGADPERTIAVDVTYAQRLSLRAIGGADIHYDHADWADAKFTTEPAPEPVPDPVPNPDPAPLPVPTGVGPQPIERPSNAVEIPLGTNPQTIIDSKAPGTTYWFPTGVFPRVRLLPKYGDTLLGAPGAILKGEYALAEAIGGNAPNVTIRNLVVEEYANPVQSGAINAIAASGWKVINVDTRRNRGGGLRTGHGLLVQRTYIRSNGQIGICGMGDDIIVEDSEINNNNTDNHDAGWEAGGSKFVETNRLMVRRCFFHHNNGPGFWTDINNRETTCTECVVEDNVNIGIYHEISYAARIFKNQVRRNGHGYPVWGWGAGIAVSASSDTEVFDNDLVDNAGGIVGIQQRRVHESGVPWLVQNLWVHDNRVRFSKGYNGLLEDQNDHAIFDSRNNRFDRNAYVVPNCGDGYWAFKGAVSFSAWRAAGHDVNGTCATL